MALSTTRAEDDVGHLGDHNTLHTRYNNSVEILSGTLAGRPGAGTVDAGTLYVATDTAQLFRSDGASTWTEIGDGTGASQLSDLSDVNTSTPTNRNVLVADGVDFESRALVEADISDLTHTDADAIHDNVSGEINAITAKASPTTADLVVIEDAAASFAKKSATISALGAALTMDSLSDVAAHTHTKGKILVSDGTDWEVLTVGTDAQVLTADSAQATGIKWAAAAGGGDVIFADTLENVAINQTSLLELASHTETLAAGDIVIVEMVFIVFQDTGVVRNYDVHVDFDDVGGDVADIDFDIDDCALTDDRGVARFTEWWQIHSASSWTQLGMWEVTQTDFDTTQAGLFSEQRHYHDFGTDDLTGSTIITVDIHSDSATATQTLDGHIIIRKISST